MKYLTKCTCGNTITVDAGSREEAVEIIKGIKTIGSINAHMADRHKGEPVPTKEQSDAVIAQTTYQKGQAVAV